ncbi:NAD-dependent epimerase/dehydratase family protein [Halobacillus fulvus]|nr:NAD-dependent epimerase/dehydratase family protein [Halobacillus fulvus]
MANTYGVTGFPGYLATELLKELFRQGYPVDHIYLIHEASMKEKAAAQLKKMDDWIDSEKVTLVQGDITEPQLGIAPKTFVEMQKTVTHFWHLAALYDLAVSLPASWRVNVHGTRKVNEALGSFSNLKRYLYFSTAYVSGKREGTIKEQELGHQEGFKNHYEYTKYEAEVLVEQRKADLPVTIIRPGIVVGHSKTGETAKFDGPYSILNALHQFASLPVLPYIGAGTAKVNLVPQDYVIQASIYLTHHDKGIGQTYHLTDPSPYQARDIYNMFADYLLTKTPRGTVPIAVARQALQVSSVRKWLGIQKQALDYFLCESEYDASNATLDLKGAGIYCPDFADYYPVLIDYYEAHRHERDKHVSIL